MLKKDSFKRIDKAQKVFDNLKRAMTQLFVIYMDASGDGIGAVLVQEKRSLAFISKALSPMKKS